MDRNKVVMVLIVALFVLSGVSLVRELVAPTVAYADGRACFDFCNSYYCTTAPCSYAWDQCMTSCVDSCCNDNQCFVDAFAYGAFYCSSCYPTC